MKYKYSAEEEEEEMKERYKNTTNCEPVILMFR